MIGLNTLYEGFATVTVEFIVDVIDALVQNEICIKQQFRDSQTYK
jgi:hypothetical protein